MSNSKFISHPNFNFKITHHTGCGIPPPLTSILTSEIGFRVSLSITDPRTVNRSPWTNTLLFCANMEEVVISELKGKSAEAIKSYIETKRRDRERIQTEIQELNAKRKVYISKQKTQ